MTHSHKSRFHKPSKTAIALVIFLPLAAIGLFQLPASGTGQEPEPQLFDTEMLLDPIALLQERIDRGEVKLDFTLPRGFLDSLMEVLDVPVPRLLVMSVLPNRVGSPIGPFPMFTTDESPLRERWGGWYVTGKNGDQIHRGNLVIGDEFASDIMALANTIDLSNRFDSAPYPSKHSDIIALTLLAHQSHIHNLIGEASLAVRTALGRDRAAQTVESAGTTYSRRTISILKSVTETLVRAMLFSGAAPLDGPIEGTTNFAAEFEKRVRSTVRVDRSESCISMAGCSVIR